MTRDHCLAVKPPVTHDQLMLSRGRAAAGGDGFIAALAGYIRAL